MQDVWVRAQGSTGPWQRVGTQEEGALVGQAPQGSASIPPFAGQRAIVNGGNLRDFLNNELSGQTVIVSKEMLEKRSLLPIHGKVIGPRHAWPRVASFIESMTYKPGHEITLVVREQGIVGGMVMHPDLPRDYASLLIKGYVQDSTKFPHDLFLLQFQVAVPPMAEDYDDKMMRYWFRETLRIFEEHELDEWFRINGELVTDPHA